MIGPDRVEVHATIHRIVHPWITAAQARGPLPRVDTDEFASADWTVQVAVLLGLGVAWVVEDPRQAERRTLREISDAIHGGDDRGWRDWANNHIPFTELQRRRRVAP